MKVVFIVALSFFSRMCFGDISAVDINNSWFKPSLVINNNPIICEPLLDGYSKHFVEASAINPLIADFYDSRELVETSNKNGARLTEVPFIESSNSTDTDYRIASFNLGGQYYALVRKNYSIGWREGYHKEVIIDKPISNYSESDLDELFNSKEIHYLSHIEEDSYEFIFKNNPKHKEYEKNISITPANIFKKGEDIYIAFTLSNYGKLKSEGERYGVFHIKDGLKLTRTCEMQLQPSQDDITFQQGKVEFFQDYMGILSDIMGGGGSCGTLNAPGRARGSMNQVLDKIIYQPWIYKNSWESSVEPDLSMWGYSGIWNYGKYKQFLSLTPSVKDSLVKFYMKNYSIDNEQAEILSNGSILYLLSEAFNHGQLQDNYHDIHKIILSGDAGGELSSLEIDKDIDKITGYGSAGGDSILTYAITKPKLLKLLIEKGFDVNKGNAFNKTPLMYAAQYDDVDSARLLLDAGADTEITTIKAWDHCGYTISTKNVSSLHYAVRYASREFIELLLSYGASTSIQDSNNNTPYDYLVNYGGKAIYGQPSNLAYGLTNSKLTDDDVQKLRLLLKPPTAEENIKKSKAENLNGEKLYQDGLIAQAYSSFRKALTYSKDNYRAKSNFSLVALKLGKYGEAAKAAYEIVNSNAPDNEKSSAYFNLGLACEKNGQENHLSYISYDSHMYCYSGIGENNNESLLHYYIKSYKSKPGAARLNKIIDVMTSLAPNQGKKTCNPPSQKSNGVGAVYMTRKFIYFLLHNKSGVPYKTMSFTGHGEVKSIDLMDETLIPLNDEYSIVRWKTNYQPANLNITFDDADVCSTPFGLMLEKNTSLVMLYSSSGKPVSVTVNENKPMVLVLYGNNVNWRLSGNVGNIKGIYVTGKDSNFHGGNGIQVYFDTKTHAYMPPSGSSFVQNTDRIIGFEVDALVDVGENAVIDSSIFDNDKSAHTYH